MHAASTPPSQHSKPATDAWVVFEIGNDVVRTMSNDHPVVRWDLIDGMRLDGREPAHVMANIHIGKSLQHNSDALLNCMKARKGGHWSSALSRAINFYCVPDHVGFVFYRPIHPPAHPNLANEILKDRPVYPISTSSKTSFSTPESLLHNCSAAPLVAKSVLREPMPSHQL